MSDVNGNGDAFIPIAGPFAVKGVNAVDADDNEVLIDMIVNVRKPDEIPPSVSINPIASIITNSSVSVAGTAADNVIVKLVEVQLDSAAWIAASGTSSWLGTFGNLTDGPHVISARSKDGSGNYSTTATASFTVKLPVVQPATIEFMYGVNKSPRSLSTLTTQAKIEKFINDNGFGLLRVRVYWNDYYADPVGYVAKIKETADAADAAGLKVFYCLGMQVNLSPYFGSGSFGFPAAMVSAVIGPLTAFPTVKDAQISLMRKYWDNSAMWNGKSLWDNHADFALAIINGAGLASRASTLIFSCPLPIQIFNGNVVTLQQIFCCYCANEICIHLQSAFIENPVLTLSIAPRKLWYGGDSRISIAIAAIPTGQLRLWIIKLVSFSLPMPRNIMLYQSGPVIGSAFEEGSLNCS